MSTTKHPKLAGMTPTRPSRSACLLTFEKSSPVFCQPSVIGRLSGQTRTKCAPRAQHLKRAARLYVLTAEHTVLNGLAHGRGQSDSISTRS